jgi:hypothetical protein
MTELIAQKYAKSLGLILSIEGLTVFGFIAKFAAHGAEAQLSCEGEGKVRQR